MVSLPSLSSSSLWTRVHDLRSKYSLSTRPPTGSASDASSPHSSWRSSSRSFQVDLASPWRAMQRRLSTTTQRMSGSLERVRRESMQSLRLRRHSLMPTVFASSPFASAFTDPFAALVATTSIAEFELGHVLGRGTFGTVRLATHRGSGTACAVKMMDMNVVRGCQYEATIRREQRVHAAMDFALICRLFSTFEEEDAVFFVMEFCPGGELYGLVYAEDEEDEDQNENQNENGNQSESESESDQEQVEEEDQVQSREYGLSPRLSVHMASPVSDGLCATESESDVEEPSVKNGRSSLRNHPRNGTRLSSKTLESTTHVANREINARAKQALRNALSGEGLQEAHAAFYLACIVSSMQYLHMHDVLYRDLKLENVVLDAQGYPKLIDFGLAKPDASQGEPSSRMVGSLDYMAPEIVQREPYGYAVDIWTFGVLMYELLVGTTPFYDEDLKEQRRRICEDEVEFPDGFEEEHPTACALVRHLLQKDPTERPASFTEIRSSVFFQKYFPSYKSWKSLETKRVRAPFVPTLASAFDTSLFAKVPQDEDEQEDDYDNEDYRHQQ